MWFLSNTRFYKCEFCEKWDFKNVNFGKKWGFDNVNFVKKETLKLWIWSKMTYWKCEFCEKRDFEIVNLLKNEVLKMWNLAKLKRFWKCEFWQTWDFENMNFVKVEFFKMWFLDKKWIFSLLTMANAGWATGSYLRPFSLRLLLQLHAMTIMTFKTTDIMPAAPPKTKYQVILVLTGQSFLWTIPTITMAMLSGKDRYMPNFMAPETNPTTMEAI